MACFHTDLQDDIVALVGLASCCLSPPQVIRTAVVLMTMLLVTFVTI